MVPMSRQLITFVLESLVESALGFLVLMVSTWTHSPYTSRAFVGHERRG